MAMTILIMMTILIIMMPAICNVVILASWLPSHHDHHDDDDDHNGHNDHNDHDNHDDDHHDHHAGCHVWGDNLGRASGCPVRVITMIIIVITMISMRAILIIQLAATCEVIILASWPPHLLLCLSTQLPSPPFHPTICSPLQQCCTM